MDAAIVFAPFLRAIPWFRSMLYWLAWSTGCSVQKLPLSPPVKDRIKAHTVHCGASPAGNHLLAKMLLQSLRISATFRTSNSKRSCESRRSYAPSAPPSPPTIPPLSPFPLGQTRVGSGNPF